MSAVLKSSKIEICMAIEALFLLNKTAKTDFEKTKYEGIYDFFSIYLQICCLI